jgi:virginiamycin B lyase
MEPFMFSSLLQRVSKRHRSSSKKQDKKPRGKMVRSFRPHIEALEDRTLLSYSQVPGALDTFLLGPQGLEHAIESQIYAVKMPILGSGLQNTPPDAKFLLDLDTAFHAKFTTIPQDYTSVYNDIRDAVTSSPGLHLFASSVDPSNPNDVKFNFTIVKDVAPLHEQFVFDTGLENLGLVPGPTAGQPVQVQLGYVFHLGFGVTQMPDRVYLDTSPTDLIDVNLVIRCPQLNTDGHLGSLQIHMADVAGAGSNFDPSFANAINVPDNRLYADSFAIPSSTVTLLYGSTAQINLGISLVQNDVPHISSDFFLDWPLSGATVSNGAFVGGIGPPTVEFKHVGVDLGTFFSNAVGPIARDALAALGPIRAVVDMLDTWVPVISNLPGIGTVTLANVIDLIANDGGAVTSFVSAFKAIEGLGNLSAGGFIDLGTATFPGYDPRVSGLTGDNGAIPHHEADPNPSIQQQLAGVAGYQTLAHINGMSLPLFQDSTAAVKALLGKKDVQFAQYTMPTITASGRWSDHFPDFIPILGPLGIAIDGGINLTTHFQFGYDSRGLLDGNAQDGFYVSQAGLSLGATIEAHAAANLVIVEVGGGGGLSANVSFDLKHPADDTDHWSTIEGYLREGPYNLFQFSGKVEAFLDAFLKIGIGPFSTTFTVDLGHFTLVDFSFGASGQGSGFPELGTVTNGILTLNMGPNAAARGNHGWQGNRQDGDESFRVMAVPGSPLPTDPEGETVDVYAFGYIQRCYHVRSIYAEDGMGNNSIIIDHDVLAPTELYASFNPNRTLTPEEEAYVDNALYLHGISSFNTWDEKSYLQAGGGDAIVYGGQGNDVLIGSSDINSTSHLYGGQLNGGRDGDVLIGGPGHNILRAGTWSQYYGPAKFRLVAGPSDNDFLYGGDDNTTTTFVAGKGHDYFFSGTGNNTFVWQFGAGDLSIVNGNAHNSDLEVTGSADADNFEISPRPGGVLAVQDTFTFTDDHGHLVRTTHTILVNNLTEIHINGLTGPDSFTVDDLSGAFSGTLFINQDEASNPNLGRYSLAVYGSPNADHVVVDVKGVGDPVHPILESSVQIGGFEVVAPAPQVGESITVNTLDGDDAVTVNATVGSGQTIVNMGDGHNTINVPNFLPAVQGNLTIDAGPGSNKQLNIGSLLGIQGAVPAMYGLTDSSLTRYREIGGIVFSSTLHYKATGGTFGNGINITEGNPFLPANSGDNALIFVTSTLAGAATTITTDHRDDVLGLGVQVVLGYNPQTPGISDPAHSTVSRFAGPLTVNGSTEYINGRNVAVDSLAIFDVNDPSGFYLLGPAVLFTTAAPIAFGTLKSLSLTMSDRGDDNARIAGSASDTSVTVNTGTHNNVVLVSDEFHKLDSYGGPITVKGSGNTALEVDDSGSRYQYLTYWVLTRGWVHRQAIELANIYYTNLQSVVLDGAQGGGNVFHLTPDVKTLDDLPPVVAVNGGGADNTLYADDSRLRSDAGDDMAWTVSGLMFQRSYVVYGENSHGNPTRTVVAATVNYSDIQSLNLITNATAKPIYLSPGVHNLDELPYSETVLGIPVRVGSVTIHGGGDDTLIVNDQSNRQASFWTVTGSAVTRFHNPSFFDAITATINYSGVANLVVNAGSGGNTITLSPNFQNLDELPHSEIVFGIPTQTGSVTIHGGGADTLILDDQTNTDASLWTITGRTVTRLHNPSFFDAVIFSLDYSSLASLVLNGGSGGNTINVPSSSTATTIHDGGTDTVVVGNTTNGVGDIYGAISISNEQGVNAYTSLTVDDSAFHRGYWYSNLTDSSLTNYLRIDNGNQVEVAPINFRQSDLRSLRILLGNSPGVSGNIVSVLNTPAGPASSGLMTTITTGTAAGSNDQIYVFATTGALTVNLNNDGLHPASGVQLGGARTLDHILVPVTVNTLSGYTGLGVFDDQTTTGQTYTVTANTITRSDRLIATYNITNELFLYASRGANTINVQSTSEAAVINAGWSNDTINVGDAANTLDHVDGGGGGYLGFQINNPGSRIIFNDQGSTAARTYSLTKDIRIPPPVVFVSGVHNEFVLYGPLAALVFNGGGGNDTYNIQITSIDTTIHGGSGTNTLAGPDAHFREFGVPTAASGPDIMRPGPDGNLWFGEQRVDKIGRMNPTTGAVTEFSISAGAQIVGVAAGPDGRVWFAELGSNKIGRISTDGRTLDEYLVPTPASQPLDVVAGPDGAVWFTEYAAGGKIGRIAPATGTITEFPIPSGVGAASITVGPDGNLWFNETQGNRIGRITMAGQVQEFTIPVDPNGYLRGITAGPDGNLWVTTYASGHILKVSTAGQVLNDYAVPHLGSLAFNMAVGPDGFLYFTENNPRKIGRISTSGIITDYSPPSRPDWLTILPDGSVWFTEYDSGKIGRLLPNAAATNQWQITGANAGTLDGVVHFSSVQNLVGGWGPNVFAFQNGGSLAGTLDGGGDGPDTLDMSQVSTVQVTTTGPGTLHGFRGTASNITGGFNNIDVILAAGGGTGSSAGSARSSAVVSSVSDPGVNSDAVNSFGASPGTPGSEAADRNAAVALAFELPNASLWTTSSQVDTAWSGPGDKKPAYGSLWTDRVLEQVLAEFALEQPAMLLSSANAADNLFESIVDPSSRRLAAFDSALAYPLS